MKPSKDQRNLVRRRRYKHGIYKETVYRFCRSKVTITLVFMMVFSYLILCLPRCILICIYVVFLFKAVGTCRYQYWVVPYISVDKLTLYHSLYLLNDSIFLKHHG